MSEIVLVHGMWHQGTHMGPLAEALRRRGHLVYVPELHRGSLAADTAVVQRIVDECATTPLVLGHSYGGSVITGLVGIRSLIYLAAYVPDAGESCASLGGALINDAICRHAEGGTFIEPAAARASLYEDCEESTAAWATALLVRQAPGHGRGIPESFAWRQVPSLDIICSRDRAVDPLVQHTMAARCTRLVVLDADHSPYISVPEEIAALVDTELVPSK